MMICEQVAAGLVLPQASMRDISHKCNRNASFSGMLGVHLHLSSPFALGQNEAQKGLQGKTIAFRPPTKIHMQQSRGVFFLNLIAVSINEIAMSSVTIVRK